MSVYYQGLCVKSDFCGRAGWVTTNMAFKAADGEPHRGVAATCGKEHNRVSFLHAVCWAPGASSGIELSVSVSLVSVYSQDTFTGLEDMKDSTYGTILKMASTKKV